MSGKKIILFCKQYKSHLEAKLQMFFKISQIIREYNKC